MSCFLGKSVNDVLNAQIAVSAEITSSNILISSEPWLPWIDGKIIKSSNLLVINEWLGNKSVPLKPLIIGTTTGEGASFTFGMYKNPVSIQNYYGLLMYIFKDKYTGVLQHYPPNPQSTDQRPVIVKLITDWLFACSSRNFIETYSKNAKRSKAKKFYMYAFNFLLDFNGWNQEPFCSYLVCHNSELPYVFDNPNNQFTSSGKLLSLQMITYWSNFAKFSNPNSKKQLNFEGKHFKNLNWPNYELINRYDLQFQNLSNIVESKYLQAQCDFFDSIGYLNF